MEEQIDLTKGFGSTTSSNSATTSFININLFKLYFNNFI